MVSRELLPNAGRVAEFLGVLGNEKRLIILSHLLESELSVSMIGDKVSLSQSALSQHLAKLRAADLVRTRRDRQMIFYSCNSTAVRELLPILARIFGAEFHTVALPGISWLD